MPDTALNIAMHSLRRSLLRPGERGRTDAELLESFVARRNESSFEAILDRHGPMVLGLCQRVLRNEADAEDAYQATFLVLVRKAASIRPRRMLGNWLYGVAHTTALKARAMKSRRTAKERAAAGRPKEVVASEVSQHLSDWLDRELDALPDIYRAAIVLCDLEGKSIKEAAQQLGCPQGTIASRVGRGRGMLARRLARHGIAFSGGAVASAIARHAAAAAASPALTKSTVDAAMHIAVGHAAAVGAISSTVIALSDGVMKTMLLCKLKFATATMLMVAIGAGATVGFVPKAGNTFAFGPVPQINRQAKELTSKNGRQAAPPIVAAELNVSDDNGAAEKNGRDQIEAQANPQAARPDRAKVVAWVNGRPIFHDEVELQIKLSKTAAPIVNGPKWNPPTKQISLPQRPAGPMPMTLYVKAIPTVKLGQELVFEVIVINKRTTPLKGMMLFGKIPVGLVHPEGDTIGADLPDLAVGETKTYRIHVTAIQPGRSTVEIRVTAEPNYELVARHVVTVEAGDGDMKNAEYNNTLQQIIELEIAYQNAVKKLENGNPKALAKLRDLVAEEFEKQAQAIRKMVPDDKSREMAPTLRRQLERQFIGMEYIRSRIFFQVNNIGNQEVKEYYDAHVSEFQKTESVKWQHVFIAVNEQRPTLVDAKRFGEDLLEHVRKSNDFAGIVKFDDGDSKARNGAGMGAHKGEIRPAELEKYLFEMKDGQIGPAIEVSKGIHLFRLIQRDPGGQVPLNDIVQMQIQNKLRNQAFAREFKRLVRELRARAVVEIESGN